MTDTVNTNIFWKRHKVLTQKLLITACCLVCFSSCMNNEAFHWIWHITVSPDKLTNADSIHSLAQYSPLGINYLSVLTSLSSQCFDCECECLSYTKDTNTKDLNLLGKRRRKSSFFIFFFIMPNLTKISPNNTIVFNAIMDKKKITIWFCFFSCSQSLSVEVAVHVGTALI